MEKSSGTRDQGSGIGERVQSLPPGGKLPPQGADELDCQQRTAFRGAPVCAATELSAPAPALAALERLRTAGFPAYLVGGCVRDSLLGRTPGDWDVTTAALPEQVEAVFAGERIIETGLKHGTVTVLLEGLPLEITTFRTEAGYSDHRHPDAVAFTPSLTEDLARRDFTVNAMACSPTGEIIDPFGGQADLGKRIIRCVGEPEQRFHEDALRILRALRFAAQLDFGIDPATAAAARALRGSLELVSRERIAVELTKLLCGPAAKRIITEYWEILAVPLPELAPMAGLDQRNKYHCFDVLGHSAAAVEATPPEPVLRWAALLHDVGKPACFTVDEEGRGHFYGHAKRSGPMAREILTRLRFDRDTVNRVSTLVELHDYPIDPPVGAGVPDGPDKSQTDGLGASRTPPPTSAASSAEERAIRKLIGKLGEEDFFRLLDLKRADSLAHHPDYWGRVKACDRLEALAREILTQPPCFRVTDLQIDGNDLIALGYPVGPEIGRTLNALLEAVLSGELPNEREALLTKCKRR